MMPARKMKKKLGESNILTKVSKAGGEKETIMPAAATDQISLATVRGGRGACCPPLYASTDSPTPIT